MYTIKNREEAKDRGVGVDKNVGSLPRKGPLRSTKIYQWNHKSINTH